MLIKQNLVIYVYVILTPKGLCDILGVEENMKYKQLLTKSYLIQEYVNNHKSTYVIAKQLKCGHMTVFRYLKKFNIQTRKQSEYKKYFTIEHMKKFMAGHKSKCTGKNHYKFKGRKLHAKGYILIYIPSHPNCINNNYILEHRLVMEKYLGRYLTRIEVVHHENEIEDDNRIKNLKLFKNNKEHLKYHREVYI